ncbi:bifunctional transcriptional activator/DNA repair enzyme AdaA [Cohnella sp. REN36]|uniref:bifunctional transcriptional activator/DNA repair enzyme AdaA n=1 Tax=Cohnella sp. REN36 TaxID=2887347 RepID=UPI001D1594E9|nr:bifunctional transcriptional activator/DNA repair enzyme AdaA [Cohnella sp. REN36]
MNDETKEWPVTDERWQAIVGNDAASDGVFWYAVKTTGIFCRPSCKSKPPNRANVRVFSGPERALAEGFRPCKRCKPTGGRLPDDEWVSQILRYIDLHYAETITLESIADACHGSPYHLHRTFKRVRGETPLAYVQRKRIEQAIGDLLGTDRTVAEIAARAGIPNAPYFVTLFKSKTGWTPSRYRELHRPSLSPGGAVK